MAQLDSHLTLELFHRLSEPEGEHDPAPEIGRALRHLDECPTCRQRLGEYRVAQRGLETLKIRTTDRRASGPACPPESEWAMLAAGLLEETVAAGHVRHAAQCAFCGPLLREAVEDLSLELGEDERRSVALLPSSSREGQKRLANCLAAAGAPRRHPRWTRWAWAVGAAAAAAVAVFFLLARLRTGPSAAGKLLAQAYSSDRNIEMRIPGAAYAPLSTVRGPATGAARLPLLRAEVMIGRKLGSDPSNPAWLALQGRALLLEGKFSDARSTLRRALRRQPRSPDLLIDLATAEYELAEQENRDEDFVSAAHYLSRALQLRPGDSLALFNRALVYERIGSLPLALEDWQHFLRVDPSSDWANKVARGHVERLKEKVGPSPVSALPPAAPSAAAAWLDSRLQKPPPGSGVMDSGDELLLDAAVTRWLPDYFSSSPGPPTTKQTASRIALDRLARVLAVRHGDRWLEDVLAAARLGRAGPAPPRLSAGFAALAAAVRANATGQPDAARRQARQAEILLREAGNPAAALRARLALAYAYQRQVGSAALCAATARRALRDLGRRPYPWLESQLLIELVSGESMMRHLGLAMTAARRAAQISRTAGYGSLHLRGLGGIAALATDAGNYRQALRSDREGLEQYWAGSYPPVRAYQFFSDMGFSAEAAGDWSVAEALAREGVSTAARTPNRSAEAMARFRLATLATLAGDRETARRQFQQAARIFSSLPADPAVRIQQAYVQVYLADLEVQTGQPARALARLRRAEPLVRDARNDELGLRFYRGVGQAELARNDVPAAEAALLHAVAIAERGLRSLRFGAGRVAWAGSNADAYRSLVRAELKGRGDSAAALGVWEWYRSGPVRSLASGSLGRLLPALAKSPAGADSARSSAFRAAAVNWLRRQQSALGKRTVVTYAQFEDGIEIWVIRKGGIRARWVPVPQTEFASVARRFGEDCADPHSSLDGLKSLGGRLYGWLIAPVAGDFAPGHALVFETDGAISRIPFQALVNPDGSYLGSRFAVVYSPGLGYDRVLKPVPAFSAADRLLSVGAPAITGEWRSLFAPLPEANDEARTVAADFRSPAVLTGRRATLPAVLGGLAEAEIFHFAGHSLAEGRRTGLVLAPGPGQGEGAALLQPSLLNPGDLRRCRLAVLSACSTAGGDGAELVDPASLVGAFLLSGVPDVVASRWNVNSAATTGLMDVFYRRLLAGESASQALRHAADAIRKNPRTAHPYFWAGFSAYGRG